MTGLITFLVPQESISDVNFMEYGHLAGDPSTLVRITSQRRMLICSHIDYKCVPSAIFHYLLLRLK